MTETRSVLVALEPGTTEEEQEAFAEEMEARDDVVDAKNLVIEGVDYTDD